MSNLQFSITKLGARVHWGIWRGQEIEGWGDSIHLLDDWGFLDTPEPRLSHIRWMRHILRRLGLHTIYHIRLGKAIE